MRISTTGLGLLVCLASGYGACGGKLDYVKTDATLGKVVVYRNGVAYFERRAKLQGDELRLKVPTDKVDDFLKSLTVRDAATGKSLPISFPRKGRESSAVVDMVIRLPNTTASEVILTYITDSPAWKPSYRVVVGEDGSVQLEGWAIVDNTSGENWDGVLIGVGSSSALSFRYDLWSVRDVHRQTLANRDQFAVAPPQGATVHNTTPQPANRALVTEFSDGDINRPQTHPGRSFSGSLDEEEDSDDAGIALQSQYGGSPSPVQDAQKVATKRRADSRRRATRKREKAKYDKNQRQLSSLAKSLKGNRNTIVIEGLAGTEEAEKDHRALDRANVFRNQLIAEGVAPARIQVRSGGSQEGRPAGIRVLSTAQGQDKGKPEETTNAPPVGESHFQSATPMTVHEGASVMVSIVKQKTEGEIVYLYDPESTRGNSRFAFKAVRFANPTKNTLETGPVTVYGHDSFIGEGLTDPIPPHATAMIPFALDRQIIVESKNSKRDQISRLSKLVRGVLTTEVKHIRQTKLSLTNRLRKPATVYVRHTVLKGWNLLSSPKNGEKLGSSHVFPIQLKAGESREVVIEESTPMTKTLDLRSPESLDIVQLYLSGKSADKEFSTKMQELLSEHRDIVTHRQSIQSLRSRLRDYRVRMDELHIQIVSLKAVKSGGSLMKHLQSKMKDISGRVQASTITLVELQEKLMLGKIRFQDKVAELTLTGQ